MPASKRVIGNGILVLLLSLLMLFAGPALYAWFSGAHRVAERVERAMGYRRTF